MLRLLLAYNTKKSGQEEIHVKRRIQGIYICLAIAMATLISTIMIPNKIEEIFKNTKMIQNIAKKMFREKDVFYIGRGIDYVTSQEASLKLKEISYIHSESYAAGELKHGPIALIENDVTVISFKVSVPSVFRFGNFIV